MKPIDFLKRVLTESKVDISKLGELTHESELPDEVVNTYAANLLTRERAAADAGIIEPMRSKIFAEVHNGWDRDFVAFAESDLPKEIAEKVKAEKITRNKWDIIRQALPKPGTETDQVKAARAEIEKLHGLLKEKDKTFEAFKGEADSKSNEFQKNFLLTQEMTKLQIADSAKQYLTLADIQSKFQEAISKKGIILTMENNTLIPKVKTAEGALMDHYVGNDKTTLSALFNTELATYLKQSNGNGTPQPTPPVGGNGSGVPPQGLSLQEMNALAVKKKFADIKAGQA